MREDSSPCRGVFIPEWTLGGGAEERALSPRAPGVEFRKGSGWLSAGGGEQEGKGLLCREWGRKWAPACGPDTEFGEGGFPLVAVPP